MRKSVRGALRESCEHLRVQIPILCLVLRTEYATLGRTFEALFEFLRIDAAEKFLECGASCDQRGGILRLEFTEVLAYRLDRPGTGRQRRQQAHQRFVDSPRKIQRRFRTVIDRGRNTKAVAKFVAPLVQIHQAEDG